MLKKKLFYLFLIVFLWITQVCYAQTIGLFHSAPVIKPKSDNFWDLAWHARLADYGDKESQFIIAKAYENGDNVQIDMKKAIFFYEKAGNQGHLESMMCLGQLYNVGDKVEKNLKKSFSWYEKAAQNGYVPAQLKMAELCQTKDFLDYKTAYYWLALGLKNMFPNQSDLERVSPDLKKLAFQLTAEQYRQVQYDLQ